MHQSRYLFIFILFMLMDSGERSEMLGSRICPSGITSRLGRQLFLSKEDFKAGSPNLWD